MTDRPSTEIDRILDALDDQFMQPEIDGPTDAWEVQANHGETHIVPADLVGGADPQRFDDYIDGRIDRDDDGEPLAELRTGIYLARLSAPGYLDCTDWSIHATEDEAREYLADTYGDDIELDDDDDTDAE